MLTGKEGDPIRRISDIDSFNAYITEYRSRIFQQNSLGDDMEAMHEWAFIQDMVNRLSFKMEPQLELWVPGVIEQLFSPQQQPILIPPGLEDALSLQYDPRTIAVSVGCVIYLANNYLQIGIKNPSLPSDGFKDYDIYADALVPKRGIRLQLVDGENVGRGNWISWKRPFLQSDFDLHEFKQSIAKSSYPGIVRSEEEKDTFFARIKELEDIGEAAWVPEIHHAKVTHLQALARFFAENENSIELIRFRRDPRESKDLKAR